MREEKRYYVYIMSSRSLTLYTGVTGDLYHRVLQHTRGENEGFTKRYHINRLVYYEVFRYVDMAIAREKQIKAWTRAKRLALIKSENPTWQDLAEGGGEPIKLQIPRSQNQGLEQGPQPVAAARDDNSKKAAENTMSRGDDPPLSTPGKRGQVVSTPGVHR
jgi:putative endonuclease